MTVAAILAQHTGEIVTARPDMAVREAVSLLAGRRIGAVPVLDGGAVAGIMSERDVIHHLESDGAEVLDWPVKRIMTAPAITVEPDMTVLGALSMMTRRRVRHLPVVEGGRLVGIVSIGDLVKFRMDKMEADAEAMLSYIQGA